MRPLNIARSRLSVKQRRVVLVKDRPHKTYLCVKLWSLVEREVIKNKVKRLVYFWRQKPHGRTFQDHGHLPQTCP